MKGSIFTLSGGSWWILILLLTASVTLNLVQMRKLRASNRVAGVRIGDRLPPLQARNLDGQQVTVTHSNSRPTVLYVFTPGCNWCTWNVSRVKSLVARIRGGYNVAGVSLSNHNLREYAGKHGFGFPIYADVDGPFRRCLRIWCYTTDTGDLAGRPVAEAMDRRIYG